MTVEGSLSNNPLKKSLPKFDGLLKFDLDHQSVQAHAFGSGRYGGEGVFVPQPGARAEDEGWLMTFLHDETQDTSELVTIHTQAMTDEPVACIQMPQRVPSTASMAPRFHSPYPAAPDALSASHSS